MSASPLRADIRQRIEHVCSVHCSEVVVAIVVDVPPAAEKLGTAASALLRFTRQCPPELGVLRRDRTELLPNLRLVPLSKSARRHPDNFVEHDAEMTLARETEVSRDLAEQSSVRDQLGCMGHSRAHYVSVGRRAKGV